MASEQRLEDDGEGKEPFGQQGKELSSPWVRNGKGAEAGVFPLLTECEMTTVAGMDTAEGQKEMW